MEPEKRHDVHVFVGDVPKIFEDAYAVNVDGTLKIMRWSTRQDPKCRPVAEFAAGCWGFYQHMGEQGDELLQAPSARSAPKPAWTPEHIRAAVTAPRASFPPEHPLEHEARLRDAEQSAGPAPDAAVVRPPIPPRGTDPEPTGLLPVRTTPGPSDGGAPTQLLEPVRDEEEPGRRRARPGRRLPGASVWTAVVAAALSLFTAAH